MIKACSLSVHLALLAVFTLPAAAQQAAAPPPAAVTLIQNVRIFDGKSAQLSGPSHVLVRGVATHAYTPPRSSGRSRPGSRASSTAISWTRRPRG